MLADCEVKDKVSINASEAALVSEHRFAGISNTSGPCVFQCVLYSTCVSLCPCVCGYQRAVSTRADRGHFFGHRCHSTDICPPLNVAGSAMWWQSSLFTDCFCFSFGSCPKCVTALNQPIKKKNWFCCGVCVACDIFCLYNLVHTDPIWIVSVVLMQLSGNVFWGWLKKMAQDGFVIYF